MAERIVVDLKNKVTATLDAGSFQAAGGDAVYEGLKQLGYSGRQAQEALSKIPAEISGDEERLTAALKSLSK
jgi:Holliday junction resolvasome RuvABC DNA-binding subunit